MKNKVETKAYNEAFSLLINPLTQFLPWLHILHLVLSYSRVIVVPQLVEKLVLELYNQMSCENSPKRKKKIS